LNICELEISVCVRVGFDRIVTNENCSDSAIQWIAYLHHHLDVCPIIDVEALYVSGQNVGKCLSKAGNLKQHRQNA